MLLYLAGLKGVDPSLREAAAVDGANEVQTFFRVVFPVMRPINIIVLVITVIESLRAFDLVWVVNKGRNGLELISALVTQNVVGEASRIGFGSALATIMLVVSLVFITIYLATVMRRRTGERARDHRDPGGVARRPAPPAGTAPPRLAGGHLHVFLIVDRARLAVPAAWAVLSSFRAYEYTSRTATSRWAAGRSTTTSTPGGGPSSGKHFLNSIYITVPAVLLTLFLASMRGVRDRPVQLAASTSSCSACSPPRTCCRSRRCSSRCSGCSPRCRCRSG